MAGKNKRKNDARRNARGSGGAPSGERAQARPIQQWQLNMALPRVASLLDHMQDGNEYASVCSLAPQDLDFNAEVRRAIADVETIRQRPLVCYIGNTIGNVAEGASIEAADDLPFNEMIANVPAGPAIDVLLASGGGSGHQVARFVDVLHTRFSSVHVILPASAMSAATLWALAAHEIWMDERAHLGPIDPQVPATDGRLVPAQALLLLLQHIQDEGQKRIAVGAQPDWAHVHLLKCIDHRHLAAAMTASQYSIRLAAQYLEAHKFRDWTTRATSGAAVTPDYKRQRAMEIAEHLGDHNRWKAHGHAISRLVAETDLKLKIAHLESVNGLQRAVRRLWALCYLLQDKARIAKFIVSNAYSFYKIGKALPS